MYFVQTHESCVCMRVSISSYCARFVAIETSLEVKIIWRMNKPLRREAGEREGGREGGREGEMSTPEDRTC